MNQVKDAIETGYGFIQVQSEDTDVFCLLLHFCHNERWEDKLTMWSKHLCINIEKLARKHADLLEMDILNLLALSGCDGVPIMHGIGKTKFLTIYKNNPVPSLHLPDA